MSEECRMDCLCECGSSQCKEEINLSSSEAEEIFFCEDWMNLWVIADTCSRGPMPHYTLVEKREDYSLYREEIDDTPRG